MRNKLKEWFGTPKMTYEEELATAVRYVTRMSFASLPDDQQHVGHRAVAHALATHAIRLERGDA